MTDGLQKKVVSAHVQRIFRGRIKLPLNRWYRLSVHPVCPNVRLSEMTFSLAPIVPWITFESKVEVFINCTYILCISRIVNNSHEKKQLLISNAEVKCRCSNVGVNVNVVVTC